MSGGVVTAGTVSRTGKFLAHNPLHFKRAFESYAGKNVEVVIREPKCQRSKKQNRYLWGVLYKYVAQYTGNLEEDIHNHFTTLFWFDVDEHGIKRSKSTTELSKKEFEEYATKCRVWASQELGLFVPQPNESDY